MVLMLQAQQHEKLKQADKAREAYQKALDSDPNLDEARKALARLTPAPEVSPSPAPEASPLPLPRLTPTEPPDGGGSVAPPQQVPEPGSPPDLIPVPEATPPHREND